MTKSELDQKVRDELPKSMVMTLDRLKKLEAIETNETLCSSIRDLKKDTVVLAGVEEKSFDQAQDIYNQMFVVEDMYDHLKALTGNATKKKKQSCSHGHAACTMKQFISDYK